MTLQSSVPRSGSQPRPRLVESSQFPSGTVAALSGASSGLSDPGRAGHCQGAEAATEGLSGSGGCNIIALLSRRPCFCFLPSFFLPFLPSFLLSLLFLCHVDWMQGLVSSRCSRKTLIYLIILTAEI